MAAEAKNPQQTLPVAVFGTISIVTVFYAFAALALVGMQPYTDIDSESGFSIAFKDSGWLWASQLVAIGELVTLPIVVLISFMAQPRLQYAMAVDGLLPPIFKRLDCHGNLRASMVITGVALTLVALLVPFTFMNDMISAGVLLSFNLTNASLVVVRRQDLTRPGRCIALVTAFNALSLLSALLFAHLDLASAWVVLPVSTVGGLVWLTHQLVCCPETEDEERSVQYRVPWVPFTPLAGIYLNYYLIAQLTIDGLLLIAAYVAVGAVFYFSYGIHHSVGNADHWAEVLRESSNMPLDEEERDSLERMLFGRSSRESVTSVDLDLSRSRPASLSPALKSRGGSCSAHSGGPGGGAHAHGSGGMYSAVTNPLMEDPVDEEDA